MGLKDHHHLHLCSVQVDAEECNTGTSRSRALAAKQTMVSGKQDVWTPMVKTSREVLQLPALSKSQGRNEDKVEKDQDHVQENQLNSLKLQKKCQRTRARRTQI